MNVKSILPGDIISEKFNEKRVISFIPRLFKNFTVNDKDLIIDCNFKHSPNILSCNHDELIKKLKMILNTDTRLCFDNSTEGNVTPILAIIYKIINSNIIEAEKIYFFTSTLNFEECHNLFCEYHGIEKKSINFCIATSWEFLLKKHSFFNLDKIIYDISIKEKKFICWNRVLRFHRYFLIGLLSKNNLLKDGYVSFFPNGTHNKNNKNSLITPFFLREFKKHLKNENLFNEIVEEFTLLNSELPLTINIDVIHNKNYVNNDDLKFFESSYFSLVTETYYFVKYQYNTVDESGIFFTEKIFKPITVKHPFIIVSRPKSLAWLKNIGYKTFHPYIDETYDTVEDDVDRMICIVNEVNRLINQTDDQWLEWQKNIKNIVEYNFSKFHSKSDYYDYL